MSPGQWVWDLQPACRTLLASDVIQLWRNEMVTSGFTTGPNLSVQQAPLAPDWTTLTPRQKRERRFQWFLNPEGVKFADANAEKAYRQRVQRLIDVYEVRQPDRVPVSVPVGHLPAHYAGLDYRTAMYEPDKAVAAWAKFNLESGLDTFVSPAAIPSGRAFEAIDYRLYIWPGRGLPADADGFQYVEGEYMTVDEYDALIRDPSDFWMRVYLPRVIGVMEPFRHLQPFTNVVEIVNITGFLMPFTRPDVRASLEHLIAAGKELEKWSDTMAKYSRRGAELGFPAPRGGFAKAPFDTIGDTLRGTKGVFMDMYRCPGKLHRAMDVMADLTIESVISSVNASKGLIATFPLHKGADGWMSDKQFDTFYWPSLRKIILALINEGILVSLFAEGGYDTRIEKCNEFPKGSVVWLFDKSDMAHAKKVLGSNCCISGNVPASLLHTGTPAEVRQCCRELIETCGKGGGYILAAGNASAERAKLENLRAMQEAATEFGTYR
jgi:uroporphyrinogen-III decarboxylase